ncbi:hypothetical protein SPONN_105 [uncultured Candidatus Thioglobus sp.]|nr:hypothetical protein SPONN_105 [uncultured Candidatus Thioglobus sp.]
MCPLIIFNVQLIWRYLYSTKSAADHGSLYQLRNTIGRSSVVTVPLDDFNACDDFFTLIVTTHILSAAMTLLKMSTLEDLPKHPKITDGIDTWMQSASEREAILECVCSDIIDRFTTIEYNKAYESPDDNVFAYAKQMLSQGCIYFEYSDAIREGDGKRVKRSLKYLLPMFIAAGRKNYAIEFFHTIAQHEFIFSPRLAEELLWTRFINVHGTPGHNIPKDLHMEHLNRLVKESIRSLQANKTKKSIARVGRALGTLDPVLANFDKNNDVSSHSGMHREASMKKDRDMLLNELLKDQVFQQHGDRAHAEFPKPKDVLHQLTKDKFKKWIYDHLRTYKL